MKGKVFISENDVSFGDILFELGYDDEDEFIISVFTDENNSYKDIISDSNIKKAIDNVMTISDSDEQEKYLFYLNNIDMIKNNIKEVCISLDIDKTIFFINNNPELKDKKVVLYGKDEYDSQKVKMLSDNLDYRDNIYIVMSGNLKPTPFKEYVKTIETIDDIVDKIKKLSLSPLETVFFVYDLLKERIYKETENKNTPEESRDLSKALLGKYIVCTGFTRIFNIILKKLGIKNYECVLEPLDGTIGHIRSILRIEDKKYQVDGIYYFDVTWDSKKDDNDKSYLYLYNYFGKTRAEIQKADDERGLVDVHFPNFSSELIYEFEEEYRKNGFDNMTISMIRSINSIYYYISGETLISQIYCNKKFPLYNCFDIDEAMKKLNEVIKYYNRPIYADTLIKVLLNVRQVEYKLKDNKYPVSIDDIFRTVYMSHWQFRDPAASILAMFDDRFKITPDYLAQQFASYSEDNKLDEQIQLVKKCL